MLHASHVDPPKAARVERAESTLSQEDPEKMCGMQCGPLGKTRLSMLSSLFGSVLPDFGLNMLNLTFYVYVCIW